MTYSRMIEIGRVVFITKGPFAGQLATIVEIIDAARCLIDGPQSGVRRHAINVNDVQLTKFLIKIRHGSRTKTVKAAWIDGKIDEQWNQTNWAQKLAKRQLRAKMTDFDRFKLMKAKQMRNRIVKVEMNKLKKSSKK